MQSSVITYVICSLHTQHYLLEKLHQKMVAIADVR